MDEELKRRIEEYMQSYKQWDDAMAIENPSYNTTRNVAPLAKQTVYSLAEVQLTGGRMIAMTITAGVTVGKYLTDTMKSTGYLHLYNDAESLMIRAEDVVAVKLTKLTTGE
jgi:hypothetical protein